MGPRRWVLVLVAAAGVLGGACATSSGPATGPDTTLAAAPAAGLLPRADLTPGVADPRVTQADITTTICTAGYTATVRPPVSYTDRVKVQVLVAYGIHDNPANYELDHLIPLELGGAPSDVHNLWPEPWERRGARRAAPGSGAESKDQLENSLRRDVCAGRLALAAAQRLIATDWIAAARQMGSAVAAPSR